MKVLVHGDRYRFWCQGCDDIHEIDTKWGFNGDIERPTFTPSILATDGHYAPHYNGSGCWCAFNEKHAEESSEFTCTRCHSYITNGEIIFLPDSSHNYAGLTMPLLDIPTEHLQI